MATVGKSSQRIEGPEKLCGRAKYIDDIPLPGCLYGATLRSTIAYGRIKKITFDPAFPWHECVVAAARDIPGENYVALIEKDQPLLASERVMHPMQAIALVAHPDRRKAYEALKHIKVDYTRLDPVLSIEESLAKKQALYGGDNVFKSFLIEKGDLQRGFAEADIVVEDEYRLGHQEQAYIENNAMAAYVEPDGAIVVMGSLQCPYYVHKALKVIFAKQDAGIRVIQAVTGGGFGGKEEYPSMIAGHAALLAVKAGKPVKLIYDRAEDMAATTKRHPAVIRHRTGLKKNGRLTAQDIDVVMDGGAYATLSAVVLSRGVLHATGPYECPNVRARARTVATNTPPNGAFRGFGAPQTLFAAELHWEKIAQALDLDSLSLRRANVVKIGSVLATGQKLKESVGASDCIEAAVKKSRYPRKRREYDRFNRRKGEKVWKGVGLALVHHGAGFTGSGEVTLASRAAVSLSRGGEVRVLAGSTEMGQGTETIFTQIAADALGVPLDRVSVEVRDTAKVPDSGPTVASRTCMVVGGLVQRAALQLRDAVVEAGGSFKSKAALEKAAVLLCGDAEHKRFEVQYEPPADIHWDDKAYRGEAYGAYSYAAAVVDIEVDRATYEVKVVKVTTVQEIGKALNPLFAEGQIIGGMTQGLGYALLEKTVYKDGFMQNAQLTNYVIPTALDTPPMEVVILEKPYSRGPFGAKGLGEMPLDVSAPAVAAAVHHATGVWLTEIPILPEHIAGAMEGGA